MSVYERLEALNIGRCGVDASQPRNFSLGVCYLKSVCGRRIGRLLDIYVSR